MRKLLALVLMATLLLTVCGCASSGVYEADGVSLTVDWKACQIDDGQNVYKYRTEKHKNVEKIVITYPNGVQYCVNGIDGVVLSVEAYHHGDISEYVSPETLYAAIDDQHPAFQGLDGGYFLPLLLGAAIIFVGVIFVIFPKGVWKTFSNRPPNGEALPVIVFRGVLIIASGLLLLITIIVCAFA